LSTFKDFLNRIPTPRAGIAEVGDALGAVFKAKSSAKRVAEVSDP
jgi:hypothetical protein